MSPRPRPPDRLGQIIAAAARVFARQGYRQTQMADVAAEMGVAASTLYRYVEGKEALFYLVVDRGSASEAPVLSESDLPVATPAPGRTVLRLRERVRELAVFPALRAAAARREAADVTSEVQNVVGELYDVTSLTRELVAAVERSARDLPELAVLFFQDIRRPVLRDLAAWIARRSAAGQFALIEDPDAAARFVLETVTWFGRHRHDDVDPIIDDKVARSTALAMVSRALVGQRET